MSEARPERRLGAARVPPIFNWLRGRMVTVHGLRPASEPEVVLAFLRGELDSHRFGNDVRRALLDFGGLGLVERPDLDSEEENRARERALAAARGWPDAEVFEGFPENVEWYHGVLPPDELERVRFIDYSYWNELSGGSRRPRDVLPTLQAGKLPRWLTRLGTGWCFEFASELATAEAVNDLIVMATPDMSELVLLEGHARLTAIFVGGLQRRLSVRAYLGLSAQVSQWTCF
jgi:hypothetical protein